MIWAIFLTVNLVPRTQRSLSKGHCFFGAIAALVLTWTPKVCRITAFLAVFKGLRLLFYILLGFG